MGRISSPHPIRGPSRYTFGPAGCVAASHTLRNEGERPTGYTEAMAVAVARRGRAHGVWRAISVANIDRKVTYFHPKIKGSIYLGNPMQTRGKVTDLWTVTRNGPDLSIGGYATYTFGPAGSVAASGTLRNEGERPTGYAEAMAAPVVRRAPPTGLQRAISLANIDRKVTYFNLIPVG